MSVFGKRIELALGSALLAVLANGAVCEAGNVVYQGRRMVPIAQPAVQSQVTHPTIQKPAAPVVQTVREKYPNRAVKIERQVAQDAGLNFVNHGAWTMFDPKGTVLAKGQYVYGKRQGDWSRWFFGSEKAANAAEETVADPLEGTDFAGFKAPILSKAKFADDAVVGVWLVTDANSKNLFSVELNKDVPNGKALWWYANGKKRREIDFTSGTVNGHWSEWTEDGQQTRDDRYIDGCRLAEVTATYPSGAKSAEGVYLYSKDDVKVDVEWWTGLMEVEAAEGNGKALKQGKWQFWYEDGEKRYDAEYLDDKPVGQHVWWHANGQKETEGRYEDGEPVGQWQYWHDSGLLSAQGEFVHGKKAGRWLRWNEDGRLVDNIDYGPVGNRVYRQAATTVQGVSATAGESPEVVTANSSEPTAATPPSAGAAVPAGKASTPTARNGLAPRPANRSGCATCAPRQ